MIQNLTLLLCLEFNKSMDDSATIYLPLAIMNSTPNR